MPVCQHVDKWVSDFVAYKFIKDHMACAHCVKKKTEFNKMHRGVDVETVLVFERAAWLRIKSEVVGRQKEYAAAGEHATFETHTPNVVIYYERSGKRAKGPYRGRFRYAVQKDGALYVIYHFDGII
jgi:hypothetical protein